MSSAFPSKFLIKQGVSIDHSFKHWLYFAKSIFYHIQGSGGLEMSIKAWQMGSNYQERGQNI